MNDFSNDYAGYAHLLRKYALKAPEPLHESSLVDGTIRRIQPRGRTIDERFPRSYDPGDDDFDHLVFALKYDGVDLSALTRIFACLDRAALTRRIAARPTSKHGRRIFFLFEFLTGERLDLEDLQRGNYTPLLDPADYFVAEGRPSPRHRVDDNLLGDRALCPVVRRSEALAQASARDLRGRAEAITRAVDPTLLARAISYLYTKETRSSFAIEREAPGSKLERFVAQLAGIGERALVGEGELTVLQQELVDPRYAEPGFRRPGDLEVYVGETIGLHEKIHHIGAPSAIATALMAAWARLRPVIGAGGAIVEAALRSFTFVFLHPFGDGNGRIHRLLLHNVLARRGALPPRLVVPISAVILDDLASYDRALETLSARILPLLEWSLDGDGILTLLRADDDLYRYPDLTAVCEANFVWLERAIEVDLVQEIELIRRFDEVRARMREVVEMPDRKEQLFLNLCLHNRGRLSRNKRSRFAELDDETVAALEAIVAEVFTTG
ncbi:MAG: Fic family protein [Nannocystaceae bacterium]